MIHQDLTVRLIGRPALDLQGIINWVDDQGGEPWNERIFGQDGSYTGEPRESAELLVEAGGRRCYRSWAPGLNPNVTKVREDSAAYLENIVNVGHGSVLEHAQYTFAIEGVDRVVTHELVRHRPGMAYSQESQRYVRLVEIPFRHPDWVKADPVLLGMADALMARMEEFQVVAAERMGVDDPGRDFHFKKEVTSDMRRYAPQGVLTGMVMSANLRALRHLIEMRTAAGAEKAIRELFHEVGLIMLNEAPSIFADFERVPVEGSDIPAWVPKRSKV